MYYISIKTTSKTNLIKILLCDLELFVRSQLNVKTNFIKFIIICQKGNESTTRVTASISNSPVKLMDLILNSTLQLSNVLTASDYWYYIFSSKNAQHVLLYTKFCNQAT